MHFLVFVFKELSVVGSSLQSLFVALIVAEFVLNVVSSSSEDDNASDLNAQASVWANRSECGDGLADHVCTEEGGGIDHNLVGMPEAIDSADNCSDKHQDKTD
jgi:hypothetical protein